MKKILVFAAVAILSFVVVPCSAYESDIADDFQKNKEVIVETETSFNQMIGALFASSQVAKIGSSPADGVLLLPPLPPKK